MMMYQFRNGIMIFTFSRIKIKPWITPELSNMIKTRNKLSERKKRQPTNENVKLLYNIFRNRVNRELKMSKRSYYATYSEEHSGNIKKKHGKVLER